MLNLTLTGREGQPGMSMTHCSTFCGECYHRKVMEYSCLIPKIFILSSCQDDQVNGEDETIVAAVSFAVN